MAGISETVDVLDFATSLVVDLKAALADGQVSPVEVIKLSISNAPAAIKAVAGSKDIPAELKDLSKEELEVIAEKGMKLAQAVMAVAS